MIVLSKRKFAEIYEICLCFGLQEEVHKAVPGITTDLSNGEQPEVRTTIIELPHATTQTLQAMINSSQAQTTIDSLLFQNGLTTNQVDCTFYICISLKI